MSTTFASSAVTPGSAQPPNSRRDWRCPRQSGRTVWRFSSWRSLKTSGRRCQDFPPEFAYPASRMRQPGLCGSEHVLLISEPAHEGTGLHANQGFHTQVALRRFEPKSLLCWRPPPGARRNTRTAACEGAVSTKPTPPRVASHLPRGAGGAVTPPQPTRVTLLWVELQSSAVAVRSAVPRQAGSPGDRSPHFGAAGQKRWSSPRESPTRPQSIW
jgi:hypothetical protein